LGFFVAQNPERAVETSDEYMAVGLRFAVFISVRLEFRLSAQQDEIAGMELALKVAYREFVIQSR
jgi:hypothetical protein